MQTDTDIIVYRLAAGCDLSDVEEGKIYLGKVQGFATFGMFVQLNDRIKGLVHKTSMKADHKEKDSVLVRVRQIRPNGNIDLEELLIPDLPGPAGRTHVNDCQDRRSCYKTGKDRGH